MRDHVLIVDGTNLLIRSQFAMMGKEVSIEADGEEVNTGPTLTFINMLSKYVSRVRPTRMVVCWDGGGSDFRKALYPEYKAERPEYQDHPKEDRTSDNLASEFLTLANIHHAKMQGQEADDLVAAYWRFHRRHDNITILSGDKDFLQLVEEGPLTRIVQLRPGGNPELWDEATVIEKMGCLPSDLPSVMALAGDKGDGVPGVAGVGHKTAIKLLKKHHWELECLLDSDEKKVQGQADLVETCYRLVDLRGDRLNYEAPLTMPAVPRFKPTESHDVLWQSLIDWCTRYGMETVIQRLHGGGLWGSRKPGLESGAGRRLTR